MNFAAFKSAALSLMSFSFEAGNANGTFFFVRGGLRAKVPVMAGLFINQVISSSLSFEDLKLMYLSLWNSGL
jgi:hypothetical protein